jgi:hypothetical protein
VDEEKDPAKPAAASRPPASPASEREARLAAALRANLRRRKAARPGEPP